MISWLEMSNANGDWPATVPSLAKGASRATTLLIFNDTFAGTPIDITWEVHADSATKTLGATGKLTVDVPFGTMVTKSINITAPASGTKCYLVLRAQKNGTTLFEETDEHEQSFRRLGGVTRTVVLDNLREGVLEADIYDPTLNPLYADVLKHYGATALPCRVADPDRKGKVECNPPARLGCSTMARAGPSRRRRRGH